MNFAFTEEQEELREPPAPSWPTTPGSEQVRTAMESELGYDADVWKRIGAELGWPAVIVPEEYGGLGLGARRAHRADGGDGRVPAVRALLLDGLPGGQRPARRGQRGAEAASTCPANRRGQSSPRWPSPSPAALGRRGVRPPRAARRRRLRARRDEALRGRRPLAPTADRVAARAEGSEGRRRQPLLLVPGDAGRPRASRAPDHGPDPTPVARSSCATCASRPAR